MCYLTICSRTETTHISIAKFQDQHPKTNLKHIMSSSSKPAPKLGKLGQRPSQAAREECLSTFSSFNDKWNATSFLNTKHDASTLNQIAELEIDDDEDFEEKSAANKTHATAMEDSDSVGSYYEQKGDIVDDGHIDDGHIDDGHINDGHINDGHKRI